MEPSSLTGRKRKSQYFQANSALAPKADTDFFVQRLQSIAAIDLGCVKTPGTSRCVSEWFTNKCWAPDLACLPIISDALARKSHKRTVAVGFHYPTGLAFVSNGRY